MLADSAAQQATSASGHALPSRAHEIDVSLAPKICRVVRSVSTAARAIFGSFDHLHFVGRVARGEPSPSKRRSSSATRSAALSSGMMRFARPPAVRPMNGSMSDLRIGLLAMKGGVAGSAMTDRLDQMALKFREVLKATSGWRRTSSRPTSDSCLSPCWPTRESSYRVTQSASNRWLPQRDSILRAGPKSRYSAVP